MKHLVFSLALGVALVTSLGVSSVQATPSSDRADADVSKQMSTQAIARLNATEWVLEDLGGNSVLETARPTLRFDESGRATGSSGCNRFNGPYVLDGDQLTLGPLASTRRACESDISIQELRYLQAIETAERVELSEPFLFLYTTEFDRPLRFVPLTNNSDAITTIVAFEGRENAVRVFVQGGRTRMNVFNKGDRVTWLQGVPVSVEQTPAGTRYVNQMGEATVSVFVPTSGDPRLTIDGEPDQ